MTKRRVSALTYGVYPHDGYALFLCAKESRRRRSDLPQCDMLYPVAERLKQGKYNKTSKEVLDIVHKIYVRPDVARFGPRDSV